MYKILDDIIENYLKNMRLNINFLFIFEIYIKMLVLKTPII